MSKNYFIVFLVFLLGNLQAMDESKIERFQWKNLEVAYIEDNRLPTYHIRFFFADGALADREVKGLTKSMFDLLTSGTRRFSQRDIADNLEYFGVSSSSHVGHEYSTYYFSGLVRDVESVSKKICHLFSSAHYPPGEVEKYKKKRVAELQSLINSPEGLADRAFREISLRGSPYVSPADGKIVDLERLKRGDLQRQLTYFNQRVRKRIYLIGPRRLLNIKSVILNECGWRGQGDFVRRVNYKTVRPNKPRLILVTIPQSTQAQIRIGRFLNRQEIGNVELLDLMGTYLGGSGFFSILKRELRVKRGLTYGAYVAVGGQREYGRAVMETFTKNKTVGETLTVIRGVIEKLARQDFPASELNVMKERLARGYPFKFEKRETLLRRILYLDHIGKPFKEFQQYPAKIRALSPTVMAHGIGNVFGWDKQTIVILGSGDLLKQLQAFGEVEVVDYQKYL